ncbi:MAG TPA: hypothetical protein VGG46_03905 [Terriglobales bacterium]
MSYSETPDGKIVLTMSRVDYERLVFVLGEAAGRGFSGETTLLAPYAVMDLLNRLNEGNPHYTPYQVPEKK